MQTNRSRFVFQRPSADLARSHLTALRYSRARIVAPEIPMPRLDSSHLSKLHREAADAVRIMAAADSCQEAKGRAVQYARTACALKQEARKLERQAEQLLEDAAGERKKPKGIITRCTAVARQSCRTDGWRAPSLPRSPSARSEGPEANGSRAARSWGSVGCDSCACVPPP